MAIKIALLPGDGIGPEVIAQTRNVLECIGDEFNLDFEVNEARIGGVAIDTDGEPLPERTLQLAADSDAVLLGAVGGPKWDGVERNLRPEQGLLRLRQGLELFANLRPALTFPQLVNASTLRPEIVSGLDIVIVRELTGGIYFGTPRGIDMDENGRRRGFNTLVYNEDEVARIARSACDVAARRSGRIVSVDKANVLESSELWRDVVTSVAADFGGIELTHMYVDNAAMQLVKDPKQFDVIVTGNMFGDILSDAAAMLTGSIGMLPSASVNASRQGLYEPIHGSAPDIAGDDIANPLAAILSLSMMLRFSLDLPEVATAVERSVEGVLNQGLRTRDIHTPDTTLVGTTQMGDAVVREIQSFSRAAA